MNQDNHTKQSVPELSVSPSSGNPPSGASNQPPKKGRHRPFNINIGMVVFFIIFLYMVINIIIYMSKDQIAVVEIQNGSIVDNGYYTGIILRSEKVVAAQSSGYINFYVGNGEKVAKDGNVYMVSASEPSGTASDFSGFSSSDYTQISRIISLYTANYTDSKYSDLYTFKYDLQNQISEALSTHNISAIQSRGQGFDSVAADQSGIVCYTYDGMESLTRNQITDDMFNSNNYEKQQIVSNQWVDSGSTAYKLITDDDWSIIIKLTPEQARELSQKTNVTIRFSKDNIQTSAAVEVFSNGESNYACLSLTKYMVRYIADRYIDLEIIESSAEGLKIPSSAIVYKDFYKIPVDYLITDEDTSESGFYKYTYNDSGEMSAVFYKTDIYAKDEQYCYVSTSDFQLGDYVGKLNSNDRYRIAETGQLSGVYNINQGYSIFRVVDILYQNDEYCIVSENTPYGVSQYDRIILNASQVDEDQIIY